MAIWEKVERIENEEGTTIRYQLPGTVYAIESRKRHIPHASREGTWDHTTYVVMKKLGEKVTPWMFVREFKDVKTFHTLIDAKEWAEKEADKEAAGGTV